MSTTKESPLERAERIRRSWKDALDVWGVNVNLGPPEPLQAKGKEHWGGNEPLAYIDLESRQVVVNFNLLERIGAAKSLTAVMAHEVGHHVKYPHTLGLAATLEVLEKRLIPGLTQSLTNIFFDLLVNQVVGETRADELCRVYQGFMQKAGENVPPLFNFYLAIYEELWGRPPGSLIGSGAEKTMEKDFPGFRADARLFAQTFYALPDMYLQFVYFCSRFITYLPDPSSFRYCFPLSGDVPRPDVDDYNGALGGNAQVERALEEARERGWLDENASALGDDDALSIIERISRGLPGTAAIPFRQALVSHHYKRLVDRYLIPLPTAPDPPPEPYLPSVTEEWELGDNPRAIDWTQSVLSLGPVAAVKPLRRELIPEEPTEHDLAVPAIEIYLDTSGSMPSPDERLNAMTLAAQILSAAAIRKGGKVRGIIYSWGPPKISDWMTDEETARVFLLNHSGGGTDYPFKLLRRLSQERSDAIRVVISDGDFLANLQGAGARDALLFGVEHSHRFVALLYVWGGTAEKELKALLGHPNFRLVQVTDLSKFGAMASGLADALFGK
jgi:hypothetical protein